MQSAADFWVYIRIIRKRLWLTILVFLITVGVILAISATAKPVYRATVRLQVLATDSSDISLFSTYRSSSTVDQIQQAQNDFVRALKSGFVAWQTIADLNLDIGSLDLVAGLSFALEGDFVIVTVESDDPGRAEAIANQQVENALEYYRGVRATPSRVLLEFVSELLDTKRQQMLDAESALLEFKKEHNIDSMQQETSALQDLIRGLKLERDRVQMERARADSGAGVYRAQEQTARDTIVEIEAELQAAREEAEALAAVAEGEEETEAEPLPITEPATESATLKYYKDLADRYEAMALGYEVTREGHDRSLEIYDEAISVREKELRNLLTLSSTYNALERDLARGTSNYSFLTDKENEAQLKQLQAERLGYIQITELARKPDAPVPSKMVQLVLVGGVVSILVGFLLSFVIEFFGAVAQAAKGQRTKVD